MIPELKPIYEERQLFSKNKSWAIVIPAFIVRTLNLNTGQKLRVQLDITTGNIIISKKPEVKKYDKQITQKQETQEVERSAEQKAESTEQSIPTTTTRATDPDFDV
jgi:antitoxin component of MazEF toxin-antitoxin module